MTKSKKKKKTTSDKENKKPTAKNQGKGAVKKKTKTTSSKGDDDATEKERKRLEREKAREEKEKERKVLAERNNQILNQMAVISGQNSFTTDVVGDCIEILSETPSPITSRRGELQSTPISTGACRKNITEVLTKNNTTQLQRTITELQNAVPRPEITITQLQETLQSIQPNLVTPPNSTGIRQQIRNTAARPQETLQSLQRNRIKPPGLAETRPQIRNVAARPTVGGKCPRRTTIVQTSDEDLSEEEDTCLSCRRLKQKVRHLQKQLEDFEEQGNCVLQ